MIVVVVVMVMFAAFVFAVRVLGHDARAFPVRTEAADRQPSHIGSIRV